MYTNVSSIGLSLKIPVLQFKEILSFQHNTLLGLKVLKKLKIYSIFSTLVTASVIELLFINFRKHIKSLLYFIWTFELMQ